MPLGVPSLQPPGRRAKTPTLLQMEAVECGAAALGIILSYFKRIVPLETLREDCGVSRDGSKASNVVKAARSYGLAAKGLKKEFAAVRELPCPMIVFWNFNHFLVVEKFGAKRVWLNDPASGPRTVSLQEFDDCFTGVVLTFEPGPDFKTGGKKPSTLGMLFERLRGSWGPLLYCLLAGLLLVVPGMAAPVFTQVFVDNVLVESRSDWMRPLLIGMALIVLIQLGLKHLELVHLRRLKTKLSVILSGKYLWHVLRLPMAFYAQRFAGDISLRCALNDKVADIIAVRLAHACIEMTTMFFFLFVMYQYDQLLASIGLASAVINTLVLNYVARTRLDAHMRLQQDSAKTEGLAIAGLQSIETLKASGQETAFFSRWAGYFTKTLNYTQDLESTNTNLSVLPSFLSGMTTMTILTLGGLRVMDGHLTIGMLVAFQSLMGSFQAPVTSLIGLSFSIQELQGDMARVNDVLRYRVDPETERERKDEVAANESDGAKGIQDPPANPPSPAAPAPPAAPDGVVRLDGKIEIRKLSFGYNRLEAPLIEDFDLSLRPGQRVALVGGSGSGKSTLARLVCGLYQPRSGDILFDGRLRSGYPRSVMTQSVAFVEQEIFLFGGTVRENLTLWDASVPLPELVRACQDACIHDVIQNLPGGYEATLLEGGANLSGGQRQRIEIARALVANPSIVVLDEATSALDAETEEMIDRNLRRRGCTCVIVAHRLSTIRDCDEIIVLRTGKIVERGTHAELYAAKGEYARLIQSEGEAIEEGVA